MSEPVSEIIVLLNELCRSYGVTIVSATHDYKMISASDRVIFIVDGAIERIQNRDEFDIEVGSIETV